MRRFLAIMLLAVFGLAFVSPLLAFGAESDASVPACCRRNGAHHCMMSASERSQLAKHALEFGTPAEKCPFAPGAMVAAQGHGMAPPAAQAIYAELFSHPAVVAQVESKLKISSSRSRQKRGPPSFFSL